MLPGVITGSEVRYLFTYVDSGGNRKLYKLDSWPATYEIAEESIQANLKLNFRIDFRTGTTTAVDNTSWEKLSAKVNEGLENGETAIIVHVLEKQS